MKTGRRRILVIVELLAFLGLLGGALGVTIQNRRLHKRMNDLSRVLYEQAWPRTLQPGDYFMGLDLRDPDGGAYRVSFLEGLADPESRELIIAVFDIGCGGCASEVPVWNALAGNGNFNSTFIGISISDREPTARFVEENAVEFPVYYSSEALLDQLRLPGVPATIRFSPSGRVEEVQLGESSSQSMLEW